MRNRAVYAHACHRIRPQMCCVLPGRLPGLVRRQKRILQIIRDLERSADPVAQIGPWLGLLPCCQGTHLGRGDEQGRRLRPVVGQKINLRLAFPCLPRADPEGRTCVPCQGAGQCQRPVRGKLPGLRQHLEGQDDQAVACQHREGFAEGAVQGRLAPAQIGVIKGGQIIVHQTGAVD